MLNNESTVGILGIGTAVPKYQLEQAETAQRMSDALAGKPDAARWARRIFRQCAVDTRYTCEPNLLEPADRCRFMPKGSASDDVPTTAERMERYRREAVPLGLEAAKLALADSGIPAAEVTHLIAVSCTGMFLPGLDAAWCRELELAEDTKRLPLTFLGCAAGLTAIRMAAETARLDPAATILIVSVELCTLHIQPSSARESLFATAFFGDGASACLVGRSGPGRTGVFALGEGRAALLPDTADDMVWTIGNYGFELVLSPKIPELVGRLIPAELERFVSGGALPELWAIHPGGRGIVDALQDSVGLSEEQTSASRSVLRRYGNMSSATILFVLQEMRRQLDESASNAPKDGIALAFGPGMMAEFHRFTYIPSAVHDQQRIRDRSGSREEAAAEWSPI